ncbi:AAA family ATPase [Vitiosangium sp. GDMCC 1.1324]|uniref:AAA family ATPase n=1 Tax=Vitiosangium sp. (strain GDMCC 1.1324) TaxID=2138576 RepID=UPI000D38706C|nr:AAA family ATPase [Vitiosangium sp. GDMCC 1.1324]PTL84630.1 AAA family ATPase [Vitiosangium sp. GDMCC 1.1324]
MYICRVLLKDVRGLPDIGIDFQRPDGRYAGWTVLAGRNGSGKSTLLKAIALTIVGPGAMRGLQRSFVGWIREGEDGAIASTELAIDEADRFSGSNDVPQERMWTGLAWIRMAGGSEPALFALDDERKVQLRPQLQERGPWAINPVGWFMVGYGPYRRLSGSGSDVQGLMQGPPSVTRLVNLFREDSALIESVQWLKELHLRRLEKREGAAELLDGVLKLLNDGLLPDSTKVDKVDSEGLWVTQGQVSLPLRDMSDGYRTVVALVMDIARQLHATYGEFKLVQQDGRWCVSYPGVVLIDEVELHLHLSWQRRIGFWFKSRFPNIQFIVTTHSPFVCQAADPKGLIRLPAPGEDRTAEHVSDELYKTVVNGTVDEAALTELFGLEHVHSDESERLRERVAQLEARVLEGGATPEEREELDRLSAQLPNTGSALVDRAVRKLGLDK